MKFLQKKKHKMVPFRHCGRAGRPAVENAHEETELARAEEKRRGEEQTASRVCA